MNRVFASEYLIRTSLLPTKCGTKWRTKFAVTKTKPIGRLSFLSNLQLPLVVVASFWLQLLLHHVEIFSRLLKTVTPTWSERGLLLALGFVPLLVLEGAKLFRPGPQPVRPRPDLIPDLHDDDAGPAKRHQFQAVVFDGRLHIRGSRELSLCGSDWDDSSQPDCEQNDGPGTEGATCGRHSVWR